MGKHNTMIVMFCISRQVYRLIRAPDQARIALPIEGRIKDLDQGIHLRILIGMAVFGMALIGIAMMRRKLRIHFIPEAAGTKWR